VAAFRLTLRRAGHIAGGRRPIAAVVDDDAASRELVGLRVEAAGFAVRRYASGTDALRAIAVDMPAFVVTDVEMPGVDGLTFVRALRRAPQPLPYIVVMSAGAEPERAAAAARAGADAFVDKTADENEWRRVLAAAARACAARPRTRA
jgi:CheY-like chemotaxis protein